MAQIQTYDLDTPSTNDRIPFYKGASNVLRNTTVGTLATVIKDLIASFFTSATVVPSTAPTSGQILIGNAGNTAFAKQSLTGDVTISATGVTTVAANAVSYAKMQSVGSASKLLGRGSAGGSAVREISLGDNLSMSGDTLNVSAGTGNVTQSSNATEADHVFVSGGADKSRVETPVTIDPATGDMDGVGDVIAESLETPELELGTTHASDDTGQGIVIKDINAGETIAQFELVYYSFADAEWMKADADAAGKFPAVGIALGASTNGNPITVLKLGSVRNDGWNWSAGLLYLDTTAGAITQTPPAVPGDAVQAIGFAKSADVAFFDFNLAYSIA